jgi:hypothetical protein
MQGNGRQPPGRYRLAARWYQQRARLGRDAGNEPGSYIHRD